MPNSPQARKRVRQNIKANERNKAVRSDYRTAVKAVIKALKAGKKDEAVSLLPNLESKVDRAAKSKVIHTGKANRIKSRAKAAVSQAS
ncbi:MAG: 30S ribosomal protein S20 [Planctomycetes bacterium]|nr:30S ribosomal protein S20 [Planctomycetota bacterium]